jgi:LexA-binding, inner membrane-associated putative hydrolase
VSASFEYVISVFFARFQRLQESKTNIAWSSGGRTLKPLPSLRWLVTLGGTYGIAALAWSLFGLLTPAAPAHFHEYSLSAFLVEVGGHMAWGLAAGLFTMDPALILLVTGESVLIDVDHIFSALNLPVEPRLSHSIFFAVFVALLLAYVGRRSTGLSRGIFWATLGAVAGHFSYDVFAGYAFFPVLSPLSNAYIEFPFYSWVAFEALAMALCLLSWFPLRSIGRAKPQAQGAAQPSAPHA